MEAEIADISNDAVERRQLNGVFKLESAVDRGSNGVEVLLVQLTQLIKPSPIMAPVTTPVMVPVLAIVAETKTDEQRGWRSFGHVTQV